MAPQLRFPWHAPPPPGSRTVGRFSRARAAAAAPRMATAAVRIPQQSIQLPIKGLAKGPQIFIHEGARQALERQATEFASLEAQQVLNEFETYALDEI